MGKYNFDYEIHGNSLKENLNKYLRYKYWFVFSVVLSFSAAYLFLRYTTPKYQANATIQIVEEKSAPSELSLFNDLNILPGSSKVVEDEIEVLRSRTNIMQVVEKLNLNKKISHVGRVKSSEIYGNAPFNITLVLLDSLQKDTGYSCYIVPLSETNFLYSTDTDQEERKLFFGKEIDTKIGKVTLTPQENNIIRPYYGEKLKIEIMPVESVAAQYQNALKISIVDDFSSIINLSIQDPVQKKAVDFLNQLIAVYNNNGKTDKKAVADRTAKFIDDRIADIYNDLSEADQSAEDFKSGRGLADIQSQSSINLNVSAANEQELRDTQIQLDMASSMGDLLDGQDGYSILPSNIGLADPSITNTTERYNQLVLERERLLKSSNEKNPVIVNIDEQLENLKIGMKSSLNSMTNNLNLRVNNLSSQLATLNSRIYSAPRNERALREITRKQQTVEGLYLYLLQKREEAQIAYASALPNSKIVDAAFPTSKYPVSPKKKIILLTAILLGLLLPAGIIYGLDQLDDKIHNAHSLERLLSDIPVVGELPRLKKKTSKIVEKNDRSVLSEALRIIRTNIDYLLKSDSRNNSKNNVVYVSSGLPSEGKTFFSTNLAMILSNTGKKILLIGADVRNPKFHLFFDNGESNIEDLKDGKAQNVGLTNFLFDDSLVTEDIIKHVSAGENQVDVIYSGKTFPNPSELLMSKRFEDLMKNVSLSYDYVIVDTAPMMPVTDTLLISEHAHLLVYVIRAGKTNKDDIEFPLRLREEGKLSNIAFVVNDVKTSELGYGGKYGYGYGKNSKKWWNL